MKFKVGPLKLVTVFIFMVVDLLFVSTGEVSDNIDAKILIRDGKHNSNSDLILWRGKFWLVHQNSIFHFGTSRSRLFLWTSGDAVNWRRVAEFSITGEEFRDPKFAVINGILFLYVLPNRVFSAEPYTTFFTYSRDGMKWTAFREVEGDAKGWLLWRPKTVDYVQWYVTGYWGSHGKSALFKSEDGIRWELVSEIHNGDRNDETDFEFLTTDTILAALRLEKSDSIFGACDAGTMIAVSKYPYEKWEKKFSDLTRLDGPCLFKWGENVLALGRRDLSNKGPLWCIGSLLNRKRTSLFLVKPDGLKLLMDLPSCGDTSYGGVAFRGDYIYFCYYSSPLDFDIPWIMGMLGETNIYMVKIEKDRLDEVIKGGIRYQSDGIN